MKGVQNSPPMFDNLSNINICILHIKCEQAVNLEFPGG